MNSRPLQEMSEEELNMRFHPADKCAEDSCCIHNPSDHHMVDWPLTFRMDRSPLMERHCSHGTGHPDPDCLEYISDTIASPDKFWVWSVHGCCGCCNPKLTFDSGDPEQDCGV